VTEFRERAKRIFFTEGDGNYEARMSNDEGMTKPERSFVIRAFGFVSAFVIRISSFAHINVRRIIMDEAD
jgi:hypothetical protein